MKTFAVTVQVDARIVITDAFITALRASSKGNPGDLVNSKPDAFLAAMDAKYSDDEEFVKAVLANGMRKMTRMILAFSSSVAPVCASGRSFVTPS